MFFPAFERVKSIGTRHAGKTYTPEGFTHLIRMQFRDPGLRFYTEYDPKLEITEWNIKGEYRPWEDEDEQPSVHITLVYSESQTVCHIDEHRWDDIGFDIADVVTHEYLHQYYCRRRGYKYGSGYRTQSLKNYKDSWQDYLGCQDEILAHAFNVASEHIVYNKPLEKTGVYRLYAKHFRQDPNIVLKLRKQALKYIRQLGVSK